MNPNPTRVPGSADPRPTFLIVDDEADVLDSLRYLFRRTYRVLTALNGEDGLAILGREDVHAVLSDQRMPGLSGDEFLARARHEHPDVIRMLVTGYADLTSVIRAVNEGQLFRYIIKPWDPAELESIVGQAMEQHRLLAERRALFADLQASNENLRFANARLSEADELKTAFLEVASHEFNTPITLVLGLSELLKMSGGVRDPAEEQIVEQISKASHQLGRLVAATLTTMRARNFRASLARSSVELGPLIREVAGRLAPFNQPRKMTMEVDVPDDLGTFELDAPKISDALLNLLTNALKFTPDGGTFGVSARLIGPDEAEIVVFDRGIGLEPRALRQLFEPFFTEFDPSRHSTGDFGYLNRGLGLGLSIVKGFVELHGGAISAESRVDVGTRVTIRLPRRPFSIPADRVESDPGASDPA